MSRPTPNARALDRRLMLFVGALLALQVANNTLPYLGLRDDSCQTMFSSLDCQAESNNHLFMPQHAVADLWQYHERVEVELDPEPEPNSRAAYLRGWLAQPDRRLNTEATRAVVHQLCAQGHRVQMAIDGERHDDACGDARLSSPRWWIPVRLYETDLPAEAPR